MKNLLLSILFLAAFGISIDTNAQEVITASNATVETTDANDVEILTNFKATKTQKKLIRKINKYVAAKFVTKDMRGAGLVGKTVKVQMNLDTNGQIAAISVIKGQHVSIDSRVIELIKAYDAAKPISNSEVAKPSVMQLNVPLVTKQSLNAM